MEKGQGKRTDTLHRDNDYLRRGDVKRLLENVVCLHEELPAQIDLIPAADVVPVRHGRWIDMGDFISCSECNATRMKEFLCDYGVARRLDVRTKYCPNCGADMREES